MNRGTPVDGSSRSASMGWGVVLATLYLVLAITPLACFAALHPEADHPAVAEVGVDCAVIGFTMLALQFVITARLRWVEAPFGLDVLLVFHRAMALLATLLLVIHPFLVAWGEGGWLLTRWHVHWYIWAGRAALVLLLVQATSGVTRRVMRLPYERWRYIHNVVAPAILGLGFVHSVAAGDDPVGGGLLVWGAVTAIAFGCWIYGRVIRPRRLLRHPFRVEAVTPEAPGVWTLTLATERPRTFHFVPGQFQFLRFHDSKVPREEHPFTIASSPSPPSDRISLTIKETGDFTAAIGCVRPGDRATVHGHFGRFSHTLHPDERNLVFVAGGVGITPLMSMLRYMRDRRESRRVLLAYANRSLANVVFADELTAIAAGDAPALEVVHVLSNPPHRWAVHVERFRLLGMYVVVIVIVLACSVARVATWRTHHRPNPSQVGVSDPRETPLAESSWRGPPVAVARVTGNRWAQGPLRIFALRVSNSESEMSFASSIWRACSSR